MAWIAGALTVLVAATVLAVEPGTRPGEEAAFRDTGDPDPPHTG